MIALPGGRPHPDSEWQSTLRRIIDLIVVAVDDRPLRRHIDTVRSAERRSTDA
jgi:hypothetical protein